MACTSVESGYWILRIHYGHGYYITLLLFVYRFLVADTTLLTHAPGPMDDKFYRLNEAIAQLVCTVCIIGNTTYCSIVCIASDGYPHKVVILPPQE